MLNIWRPTIIALYLGLQLMLVTSSVLKTDSSPNKCVVETDGVQTIKSIGEIWTSGTPCKNFTCDIDENGSPYEKVITEFCSVECKNEYEMRILPGKCCGECVKTKCKYDNKLYDVGDTWRSQDHCMLHECTRHNELVTISSYKKSCPDLPKNCPEKNIYEEECCRYCRRDEPLKELEIDLDVTDYTNENAYKSHPCTRDCLSGAVPMRCEYTFTVEWYETLSKACYDCPYNKTDCNRPHCIVGDGNRRSVLVINRMMPGPAIEVCVNDTIVVDVKNHLLGDSTTVHWHGLHQRETPYMDGVPHISQCPISPHTTFRYEFIADHPGTHFWHSHTGMQRGDGSFGALIIRQPIDKDPQAKLYDFDLTDHMVIVQDWGHMSGIPMFSSHHHSIGSNKPPNILINGKGRYFDRFLKNQTTPSATTITTTSSPPSKKSTTTEISKGSDEVTTSTNLFKDNDFVPANANPRMKIQLGDKSKRSTDDSKNLFALEKFRVVKGYRYRFRVINAEFLNCPVSISVDNHTLLVINSDGYDLEPVEVTSLVTYAGERFDFVLHADQQVGNYWMRVKGLMDCDERFTSAHQAAVLHYEGASNDEPDGIPTYDHEVKGLELNALNKGPGEVDTLSLVEMFSIDPDEDWITQKDPDFKFYVYYDFYPKDNPHFHVPNLYGFNQIHNTMDNKLFTPQLNHISMKMPSLPLMPARDQLDQSAFCNATSLAAQGIDCRKEFCECSHVLQVPLGAIVEMVLIDEGVTYDANHPFHLHGNAFRVVGMDRIAGNISVEEIKRMDQDGLLKRKLKRAPIKDTVTIPDGGYTIIRFKAYNPGYWLFHCHIEFHAEIGMALVLKVGEHHEMIPVPENFPTCSDYIPKRRVHSSSGASTLFVAATMSWILALSLSLL